MVDPNTKTYTEKDIKYLLSKRYTAPTHAFFTNVANSTGAAARYADGIAVSLWPSSGFQIDGFEIKVSRSDFLNELKNPQKSSVMMEHCDRWWIVAPKGVCNKEELPKPWGLFEVVGDKLFKRKIAHQLDNKAIDLNFFAALLRRSTEGMVHVDTLGERIRDIDVRIREELRGEIEREKEIYNKLKNKVSEFEKSSGVEIDTWGHSAQEIGNAVRLILDGGIGNIRWEIERVERGMKDIAKNLPNIQEILKVAETIKEKLNYKNE